MHPIYKGGLVAQSTKKILPSYTFCAVNERLLEIKLHTFRHWNVTTEYRYTKDPYHVRRLLGHKSLQTTELYINIEPVFFQEKNDQFHVKIASKPQEIKELLEVGFEYICEKDRLMFFRKRK